MSDGIEKHTARAVDMDQMVKAAGGCAGFMRSQMGRQIFIREDRSQGDIDVINEVLVGDTYRIGEMMEAPALVFDIGSHIGTFTLGVLWKFDLNIPVVCVEPHPVNHALLEMNLKQAPQAEVLRGALSYKKGDVIADGARATGGGIVMWREDYDRRRAMGQMSNYPQRLEIGRTWTIRDLFERATHRFPETMRDMSKVVMKWDCEGGEVDAFTNMSDEERDMIGNAKMVGEYHMAGGWNAFHALLKTRWPSRKFETTNPPRPDSEHIGWWRSTL